MTIQSGQNLAGSSGVPYRPENVEVPVILDRDPTSRDVVNYPLGKRWLHRADSEWVLYNQTTINGVLESDWRRVSGGLSAFLGINVPLGITPIVPNSSGYITFTSNNSSVQITGSAASPGNNFIDFSIPGGQPASQFGVDATSGSGTNPVVPDVTGLVTINGVRVAAGTNPIRTVSTLPNSYQIQLQTSQAIASTDATKVGVAAFDSADFTVDANGFVTLSGSVPTSDLHVAKWIVNPAGSSAGANQTTITAAMAAASSGDTIFVMPATYTENFTWKAGVNIVAFNGDQDTPNVTIIGKITCTDAGSRSMSGIRLQTNSDFLLVVSGSANTVVNFRDCYFNCTNNTGISITSSGAGSVVTGTNCSGDIGTTGITFCISSASTTNVALSLRQCLISNSGLSTTPSTFSGSGGFVSIGSYIQFPVTTSGTAPLVVENSTSFLSTNTTAFICGGVSVSNAINNSHIASGNQPCINVSSDIFVFNTVLNTSTGNALTGSGTIQTAGITFNNGGSGNNVTTKVPYLTESGYYRGLQTGSSPLAGTIGEQIRSSVQFGSAVSLTFGVAQNITSISVTAGIWNISCVLTYAAFDPTTSVSACAASISTTSNTLATTQGYNVVLENYQSPINGYGPSISIPSVTAVLATTTTYYLVASSTFAVAGMLAYGTITATRIG